MTAYSPYQAYPSGPEPVGLSGPPPILVAAADRLPQRRVTVAFRLILVIPHFIALWFLSIAAAVILFLGWWGALFAGRLPEFAGSFLTGYLRWTVRVYAYSYLLTDVYPPFTLDDDPAYPVRLVIPPAQPLNRAAVLFRIILSIPASIIVVVLTYGAGTLMGFIAWLVTLFAGRLPESFHLALTAVLRYLTRFNGYMWMLTPAYPGSLYGDSPGTATWADELPAAGTPGFEAPAWGYDTPGQGYDAPGQGNGYGTPDQGYGYGTPSQGQGYATPPSGYGNQAYGNPAYGNPAYGNQGYSAPGYGTPGYGNPGGMQPASAGYGVQPAFQPGSWLLLLTSGARRLLTAFIVLGAVLFIGYVAVEAVFGKATTSNVVVAGRAIPKLDTAYSTLASNLKTVETAEEACAGKLSCVTPLDAKTAGYFRDFTGQLAATAVPASALPDAAKLDQTATAATQDFTELSQATSTAQYQSTFGSTGVQQTLKDFDTSFTTLMQRLGSY